MFSLCMTPAVAFLSFLYGRVVRTRARAYEWGILSTHRSALPVISVGNVTAGGNAKTPLCIYLANELSARNLSPVVLLRGYGGKKRGPYLVQREDSPFMVGDEACLFARKTSCPVVIARNRVAGARFIEQRRLGQVIVLDDGLQHRALFRDLEIISINMDSPKAIDDFVAGKLLPHGMFREPRDEALRRADMVILAERKPVASARIDERVLKLLPRGVQLYRSFVEPQGVRSLADGSVLDPTRIVACCAIANPEGFHQTLTALGFEVANIFTLPDHAPFNRQSVARIGAEFPNLPIVCTEKDAVKIDPAWGALFKLEISTRIHPADAFMVHVLKTIMRTRRLSRRNS